MSTETTRGGFVGDPDEAFAPPAAGGCCGTAPADSGGTGCCGTATVAEAPAATRCCE
jgi:hypothetical protein